MALVNQISVMGSPLDPKIRGAITRCDLDSSISQVTQLEMELTDPQWKILESGLFAPNQRVEIGSLKLEISAIQTGDNDGTENISLKCRPLAFRLLKDRQGARVLNNVSPSEFVAIECQAVGVPYVTQPTSRRSRIARDILENGQKPDIQNPPSSWTTFNRLAREVGFYMFESQGTIYFGKPSWLLDNASVEVLLNYQTGANDINRSLTTPACARTLDDPAVTISAARIVAEIDDLQPGQRLVAAGIPTFNGRYLITDMSAALLDTPNIITFTASTPNDPIPTAASGSGGITGPWYDESKL